MNQDGGTDIAEPVAAPPPTVGMRLRLRPTAVVLASTLVPGLGHLAIGYRGVGLLYLVPTLVAAALAATWVASAGIYGVAAWLVTPGALTVLIATNILLAGWRTSAAVDVMGRTSPGRGTAVASAIVLLVVVGIPHLVVAGTLGATDEFLDATFAGAEASSNPGQAAVETPWPTFTEPPEVTPTPFGATPAASDALPTPSPTPVIPPYPSDGGDGTLPDFGAGVPWERADPAQPWGDDGRLDLLLIGSDAGAGRWSRRNDVMLLVEVDVATGKVAMIGLPRNLQNAPYPPGPARDASACGCQPGLMNEMYVEATARRPSLWPGRGAVKGIGAVRSVVSTLTGRPIDAVLIVDLIGVIRVVDAMGGVDINVPYAIEDWAYPDPGSGKIHIRIKAGKQHMDGHDGAGLRPQPPPGQRLRADGAPADAAAGHPQAARSRDYPQCAGPVRRHQGHRLDGPARARRCRRSSSCSARPRARRSSSCGSSRRATRRS